MKKRNARLGLSILAGGLSFVGAANAVDLITNGSFESAGSWKYFGTYNYSTAYFSGPAIPASENPGNLFATKLATAFSDWDHFVTPTNETDHLNFNLRYAGSQTVELTNALSEAAIDAGFGRYNFSSWLSSYGNPGSNPEQPYVVLRFYDAGGIAQVGDNVIFDRTKNTFAVTFADGNTTIPEDVSANHDWIKYVATGDVPVGARKATVFLTRSPNAPKVNSPDTYIDLVKLDISNFNDNTALESASPPNNQTQVSPDAVVSINLRDVNNEVVTNTIQLMFDGVIVAPSIEKSGTLTTVQYDPPGLLPAASSHTYRIVWTDNGATTKTNEFTFSVASYLNIVTGPPIFQENFDGVAEGSLPAGWSVSNFTDQDIPGADLNNFHSDSYMDWVVISRGTLSNLFNVIPGGEDYPSTLNVAPFQFVNGMLVTDLISNNFAFAASAWRFGNQAQFLTTSDYNLSGKTDVYLFFNEIFTQNQDSLGAVEYSIDGGTTWLPALYLLDVDDVVLGPNGNIDASSTFSASHDDLAAGSYGASIGVAPDQWGSLAPFISPRINDDLTSSHRVEIVRLAQADNQSTVRIRFANIGNDSYYFGIDDFALYSISNPGAPVITTNPTDQLAAAGNSARFVANAIGVGTLSYQWRHAGTNLVGNTGQVLTVPNVQLSDAGAYDVVVTSAGGSVTSSPPAMLTVINPKVQITGQWDFNGDLAATIGQPMEYFDTTVSNDTAFGTTTSFGINDINGQPTTVMRFSPSVAPWGGYKIFHGATPNGGGQYVNQYTLIYDLYYPGSSGASWRSLWQTLTDNSNDGDVFISPEGGIGISQIYNGVVTPDEWHRIAFVIDLAGPGAHPVLVKFIDGVKVGEQTTGLSGVDGRFSLDPSALLFADNDGDAAQGYVSSIQFANGRLSDAYLAALGGPTSSKLPGAFSASLESGNIVLRWTGDAVLLGADDVAGPYQPVAGATSPYTPPPGAPKKFYRLKIQ